MYASSNCPSSGTQAVFTQAAAATPEQTESSGGPGRRAGARNVMPVSVRQVVQAGAGLQVAGVEAGLLTLVVQVKQVTRTETGLGNPHINNYCTALTDILFSVSYMVDDDTGRIEAVHYVESEVDPAKLNTFVRLFGLLKCGREQNMITVYKLFPVLDRQERDAHLLGE